MGSGLPEGALVLATTPNAEDLFESYLCDWTPGPSTGAMMGMPDWELAPAFLD